MIQWWQSLIWASPSWQVPALIIGVLSVLAVLGSYITTRGPQSVRWTAAILKAAAVVTLALCLLEPMRTEDRPRPGANLFVVLADNSRSVTLEDNKQRSLKSQMQLALEDERWQTRLGQDFDVRRYQFDQRLQSIGDWESMTFDGERSALGGALDGLLQRFEGQPLAGILVMSDGNATDQVEKLLESSPELPPIYPVEFRQGDPAADAAIGRVSVRQTNFEDSPVLITADVSATGFPDDSSFEVTLLDVDDEVVDKTTLKIDSGEPAGIEMRVRPEKSGVYVYRMTLKPVEPTSESTQANNQRLVMVHRRGGPYRILYVAGRPNWEFKFLRRATEEDSEMDLLGLLRIARKEPKFVFRDRDTGDSNPLFQGFEEKDPEDVEQYDQPVVVRIGVEDKDELRDGFPKDAEELFKFHCIILDDLESRFFQEDQLSLIKEFVSQRGGGLLMLGGAGSFSSGGYEPTLLSDMLPVYLDATPPVALAAAVRYRMKLSRDGWIQPWIRMREEESAERKRLAEMPTFATLNHVRRIKPGATVLATVDVVQPGAEMKEPLPALVSQRYGKGRSAALLIGDYWKWAVHREFGGQKDLEKAWRQMLRWMLSDVPQRIEATATKQPTGLGITLRVEIRDEKFRPLDNAELDVTVSTPGGRKVSVPMQEAKQAGIYEASFAHREAGAYMVKVNAKAPDGSEIGDAETGWMHEPDAEEFQSLNVNRPLLQQLARQTDGKVASASGLLSAVSGISQKKAMINEKRQVPLWHRWYVFLFAALCLAGEWGLRRWHGLP